MRVSITFWDFMSERGRKRGESEKKEGREGGREGGREKERRVEVMWKKDHLGRLTVCSLASAVHPQTRVALIQLL